MNAVVEKDVVRFANSFALSNEFVNTSVIVTGATGLIGSLLIYCLIALNKNIKIIAPVRNIAKAKEKFSSKQLECIQLVECDLFKFDYDSLGSVDYIIHCAAPTASKFFVDHPVDTFAIIYEGTKVLLDYAVKHKIKGFVYLSSLEVYGEIIDDSVMVDECTQGYLNPLSVRSSYPMAKRAVENLCCLYAAQYGVFVKIARLTQTTGAGIAQDDNRVIAQFARLAASNQDIILHTTGESARPYCYTMDCISAILYVLVRGKSGEAYNVANESTYISARGMAELLQKEFSPSIKVKIELNENMGYAPASKLRLSSAKLRDLGWEPQYGLKEIFEKLIEFFKQSGCVA